VDVNVDMGESYGRWRLGDDAGVMPWITSANIACGFHAGDPATMRATARLAIERDVAIGAHVGFPDLLGFGRRRIDVTPDEVRDYAAYQIGALQAIVASESGTLRVRQAARSPLRALLVERRARRSAGLRHGRNRRWPLPAAALTAGRARGRGAWRPPRCRGVSRPRVRARRRPHHRAGQAGVGPERVARRAVRIVLEQAIDTTDGSVLQVDAPRSACTATRRTPSRPRAPSAARWSVPE
jgi:UPF0271 protein